ncbi:blue copper protein-like [Phoenix dactylifera]|uniref:Blue copper protein-like n=1 Tax=Phoenix dactylifera TaxID=42345 RepID=A0A8B7MSM7_PHODC|nr:blue copper protein-like [Phoenix dactylifera]
MEKAVVIAALVTLASVGFSSGAVYTVGDKAGWTIIGNVNYTAWASTKNFHVGDIILFVYNKNFHNVMEVNKEDFKACNAGSPLTTHTSGNDSFTIKRRGHHFFLCGVPGHCGLGQKVDIRVPKLASSAAPSGAPATAPSTGGPAAASGSASTPTLAPRPAAPPPPPLPRLQALLWPCLPLLPLLVVVVSSCLSRCSKIDFLLVSFKFLLGHRDRLCGYF